MKPEPSERLSGRGALRAGLLPRDEAAEELEHLLVFHARDLRQRGAAHHLGGADVDHRAALLLHQAREVRQVVSLREDHRAQSQVRGDDVPRQDAMRADEDVHVAGAEVGEHLLDLGRRPEPRDRLDPHREVAEAVSERAAMLLGEDGGRRQHQHLAAAGDGLECAPQRDLGLAEADVAADQPVHRALLLHVLGDRVDRTLLVVGLLEGEAGLQPGHHLVVAGERRPGDALPACVQREQLAGQLADGGADAGAQRLPRLAAQPGQAGSAAPRADVAADLAELLVWDVEAVVAAELQVQVVADHPAHLTGVEADEAADPVVVVDDVVAGRRSPNAASARPIGSGARDVRRRNSWAELSTASRRAG